MNGSWKLREHRTALRKAYAKGVSLLDLSREYDLPPVAIFRYAVHTSASHSARSLGGHSFALTPFLFPAHGLITMQRHADEARVGALLGPPRPRPAGPRQGGPARPRCSALPTQAPI